MTGDPQKQSWSDRAKLKMKTSGWLPAKVLWSHKSWRLMILACDELPLPAQATLYDSNHGQVVVVRQNGIGGYEEAITGTPLEYQRERLPKMPEAERKKQATQRRKAMNQKASAAVSGP